MDYGLCLQKTCSVLCSCLVVRLYTVHSTQYTEMSKAVLLVLISAGLASANSISDSEPLVFPFIFGGLFGVSLLICCCMYVEKQYCRGEEEKKEEKREEEKEDDNLLPPSYEEHMTSSIPGGDTVARSEYLAMQEKVLRLEQEMQEMKKKKEEEVV